MILGNREMATDHFVGQKIGISRQPRLCALSASASDFEHRH